MKTASPLQVHFMESTNPQSLLYAYLYAYLPGALKVSAFKISIQGSIKNCMNS